MTERGPAQPDPRRGERGSALVIAILVSVVLALLGISFLLMGETENRISQNEKRAAQAFYVAESAVRVVKGWFDDPLTAMELPSSGDATKSARWILDESDPYDESDATPADGSAQYPYYKQGGERNFDRPYRGGALHAFMGIEGHPDILIDDEDYLRDLSKELFENHSLNEPSIVARISSIEVFAPPYLEVGGAWSRYGLATVKVVARIVRIDETSGPEVIVGVLGEREVRAVVSEAPYYGVYGPLHSCGSLQFTGELSASWGPVTAVAGARLSTDLLTCVTTDCTDIATSVPRSLPASAWIDPLWTDNETLFDAWTTAVDGETIPDPWFRVLAGGEIEDAPAGSQPFLESSPGDSPPDCCDRSNLFQSLPVAPCPDYDYETWKTIASSGGSRVHYYTFSGGGWREDGAGEVQTFLEATQNEEGIYFFDTLDGLPPNDTDGDGEFDNVPNIYVTVDSGSAWNFRGVIYLNARALRLRDGVTGGSATVAMPGEPFLDIDLDGEFDAGVEPWVNLDYPATIGGTIQADAGDTFGGSVMRNARGPDITVDNVAFHGLLYVSGQFVANGGGTLLGSVVARSGVTQAVPGGSTPDIYWDASLAGEWPPQGMRLPRVVITGWLTER
ncbi:MAG: hypothetical protein GY716_07060 [bacterium]|nr:hypothetical protein [bacterium]